MKFPIFMFILLLYSSVVFSQLTPFQLSVDSTNETCLNNGTISVTTQGITSGAAIALRIFRLPDLTLPISTSAVTNGLNAGNYQVVAVQTLITPTGTQTNEQIATTSIINQIVDLNFNVTKSNVLSCATSGAIIVNTVAGTPLFYEIVDGPSIVASQNSNEFTGLSAGRYSIRVTDNCGNSTRKDFTLVLVEPRLSIVQTQQVLNSCTSIDITNTITAVNGTNIAFPLTVLFTVRPPGGAPNIVTSEVIVSGNATSFDYIKNIAITSNVPFEYDLQLKDACGTTYSSNRNIVSPNPILVLSELPGRCGVKFLNISTTNFIMPLSINFLQSPAGFNATTFNGTHPGPFSSSSILYGNLNNPVPFGLYEVEVTDSCGRSDKKTFQVLDLPVNPTAVTRNNGCGSVFGSISISVPGNRKIVSAIITSAPPTYSFSLPNNVSSLIDSTNGILLLNNLPIGIYNFTVIDDCDDTYLMSNVQVPRFILQGLNELVMPNCISGSGSLALSSGNAALISINITNGPINYSATYPVNVSNNIRNGVLYLSNLPAGIYSFAGIDRCGYALTKTFSVIGYNRVNAGFSVQRNCGTFDLTMADNSNGTSQARFWLQRLNLTTNVWEHPFTNTAYINGSIPTLATGFQLSNNATVFNLMLRGTFRILKTFQTFDFGTAAEINKTCLEDLGQFEYAGELKILGAYNLNCDGGSGSTSMIIDAVGVPPYNFSIVSRDGLPFSINNGSSNTFTGLIPATYSVLVTDRCEGRTGLFTLANLVGLVTTAQPTDILDCRLDNLQISTIDLTSQNSSILGTQNPRNYQVSYYLSAIDAQNAINAIANPVFFANTSNPQTIHARVTHRTLSGCSAIRSFQIFVGREPQLAAQPSVYICDSSRIRLTADLGYSEYRWSSGQTTRSIEVAVAGVYSVTASNIYGTLRCSDVININVILSGTANSINITPQDWTDNTNSLTVIATGNGIYEYSLDNVKYQTSNIFTNLVGGLYTVFVKDVKGLCGIRQQDVVLLNYPKFFTPNGDGYNENWKVRFSEQEPNFYTYIYDRYGKLLTGFDNASLGWNGLYNNQPLPADDYWFVINRQDGKVYKGHFTLKR